MSSDVGKNEDEFNNVNISPLSELFIDTYKYKYKDSYKSGICYRCIHRAKCKLTILISYQEYKKF